MEILDGGCITTLAHSGHGMNKRNEQFAVDICAHKYTSNLCVQRCNVKVRRACLYQTEFKSCLYTSFSHTLDACRVPTTILLIARGKKSGRNVIPTQPNFAIILM